MESKLPTDEFRCTGISSKGAERCPNPRIPATDLCRHHHLARLAPAAALSPPSAAPKKRGRPPGPRYRHLAQLAPAAALSPPPAAPKKRGRPPGPRPSTAASPIPRKRGRPPGTSTSAIAAPADNRCTGRDSLYCPCSHDRLPGSIFCKRHHHETPPIRPQLPDGDDDRCVRNDGKRWRCSNQRLPDSSYCEKHHRYNKKMRRPPPSSSSSSSDSEDLQSCRTSPSDEEDVTPPVQIEPPKSAVTPTKIKEIVVGDVWAVAAGGSGDLIPNTYSRIDRIVPGEGTVEATPLIPHPVSEEEMECADAGLPVSCGLFRASPRRASLKEISGLSHRVISEGKMKGSFYRIFPRTGEVWAVHDEVPGKGLNHYHHLVEIVSGYTEEDGVTVARLVKVEGDGTGRAFRREVVGNYELRRVFARKELIWFSHHVPAIGIAAEDGSDGGNGTVLWKVSLLNEDGRGMNSIREA